MWVWPGSPLDLTSVIYNTPSLSINSSITRVKWMKLLCFFVSIEIQKHLKAIELARSTFTMHFIILLFDLAQPPLFQTQQKKKWSFNNDLCYVSCTCITMSILHSHVLHNHNTLLSCGPHHSRKLLWDNICSTVVYNLHSLATYITKVFVMGTMSFLLYTYPHAWAISATRQQRNIPHK